MLGLVAGVVILTQEPGSAEDRAAQAPRSTAGHSAALVLGGAAQRNDAALTRQRLADTKAYADAAARAEAARVAAARKAQAARAEAARKAAVQAQLRARTRAKARAARSAARNPQAIAKIMVRERGWGAGQFSCLDSLWTRESNWDHTATNPSSGAYGIPQSLPARKMASAGSDYRTNPVTQIEWGLGYIEDRFGTPCGAWAHSESHGWY